MTERKYIKIGIAGPVGSGKTALIERISREMIRNYSLAVITNDIYSFSLIASQFNGIRVHTFIPGVNAFNLN